MSVFSKLTLKNLRLNKTRTIVTIIGIMLSVALITVVAGMATSAQQTMIDVSAKRFGNYDICFGAGITEKDVSDILAHRNVINAYVEDEVGTALIPEYKNEKRPYVFIRSLSENAFGNCFSMPLKEGRYPKNSGEIVITQKFLKYSNKAFKVGDTITLEVGQRKLDDGTIIYSYTEMGATVNEKGEWVSLEKIDGVKKSYKIVGIADDYVSGVITIDASSPCADAYTMADLRNLTNESEIYVDLDTEGEKNYKSIGAEILGITEEQLDTLYDWDVTLTADEIEDIESQMRFDYFNANETLLTYKGYNLSDNTLNLLYSLGLFVIAIIVIASVFVIRNSFAISITEKTKLYGMFASVGATSGQIRRNVLFEGFVLGVIGIPIGILLGAGVVAGLLAIFNVVLVDLLQGNQLVYSVPLKAIIVSVLFAVVVIVFSTLSSAIRASRVSPIEAIRNSRDIKLKGNSKAYKTPKFITKLFGIGGVIAYKNLKRNKKKYRTTVISIIVSVALFITVSSIIDYFSIFIGEYHENMDHNISVQSYENYVNWEQANELLDVINDMEDTKIIRKQYDTYVEFRVDKYIGDYTMDSGYVYDDSGFRTNLCVMCLDDTEYNEVIENLGYKYEDVKDKAILWNTYSYYIENDEPQEKQLLDIKTGDILTGTSERMSMDDESVKIDFEVVVVDENTKTKEDRGKCFATLLVSEEWMKENIPAKQVSLYMDIYSEDADGTVEAIDALGYHGIYVANYDETAKIYNAISLVIKILTYGFIIVISLIGITNIFNTITTNMSLRKKEFAMLQSVGMTKKELNKMIGLESFMYGVKSLLIGLPLGIVGGIIALAIFQNARVDNVHYIFPWFAILVSIVFVLAVVWLIMRYSIKKAQQQNIIETIRNDNI